MKQENSIFNQQQMQLLEKLAKEFTFLIIVIDPTGTLRTEIYTAIEFREATQSNQFNSMFGYKVITDIIARNSTYIHNQNALKVILDAIDILELPSSTKERKFSNQFIWIKL